MLFVACCSDAVRGSAFAGAPALLGVSLSARPGSMQSTNVEPSKAAFANVIKSSPTEWDYACHVEANFALLDTFGPKGFTVHSMNRDLTFA